MGKPSLPSVWKCVVSCKANERNKNDQKYAFKNYNNRMMNKFVKLWKNELLCDVNLIIEGKQLSAHKMILAVNSDYFEAMFSHWYEENKESSITLNNLTYNAVYSIIEFMYTGTLTLSADNVEDIFIASDLLQMTDIKLLCSNFIFSEMDASNCIGLMNLGEFYNCKEMYNGGLDLLKLQFLAVCQTEEFLSLPLDRLITILSYDDLCLGVEQEVVVLKSVMAWLKKNCKTEPKDILSLFKHVRLMLIEEEVILENLKSCSLTQDKDLYEEILKMDHNNSQNRRLGANCIYVFGGFLQSRTGPVCPRLRTVEKYNIAEDKWEFAADLPILSSKANILNFNGRILLTCLELVTTARQSAIMEYDPVRNKWKDFVDGFSADVHERIESCLVNEGVVVGCQYANSIYLICNEFVNKLHMELQGGDLKCTRFTSLPRVGHFGPRKYINYSCVVHERNLYVLGGDVHYSFRDRGIISDVGMFDGTSWINKCKMNEARSRFAVVIHGDAFSAIGGYNIPYSSKVETYNPSSDQWTYMVKMNKARSDLNAVAVNDKLFVLGGKSYSAIHGGARKVLNSCEVWHPHSEGWQYISPMAQARCMFGSIAL